MISVLMPSRERAQMCFDNLKKAHSRAKTNPEFLIYLDNNDPQLDEYDKLLSEIKDIDLNLIVDVPRRSAKAMKYLAQQAKYEFMIFGTDDLDWRTDGWDEKLIAKMPAHGLSVVFPASIPGNKIKARIPFFTKKWRDITGLFPDDFIHFGPDGYIVKVAESAKVEIFAYDVEILHSRLTDATAKRARVHGTGNWKDIVKSKMPEIVERGNRIKAAIEEFNSQ